MIDITNNRYGRLLVTGRVENDKHGTAMWRCICNCGKVLISRSHPLKTRRTVSCGCYNTERISTHKMSYSKEYDCWAHIKDRCSNKKNKGYHNYGGRGISVCDRWLKSFENFYKDMGDKPSDNHSIERLNNNKNYSPDNCKWATAQEQSDNRRANHNITYNGLTMNVTQWSKHLGFKREALNARLMKGWSIERCLTTPIRRKRLI